MGCGSSTDGAASRPIHDCAFCRITRNPAVDPLVQLDCGHHLHRSCKATLGAVNRGCPLWICSAALTRSESFGAPTGYSPAAAKYMAARRAAKELKASPPSCMKGQNPDCNGTAGRNPDEPVEVPMTPPRRLAATQAMLRRVAFVHMSPQHSPASSRSASPRSSRHASPHGSFRNDRPRGASPSMLHPMLADASPLPELPETSECST